MKKWIPALVILLVLWSNAPAQAAGCSVANDVNNDGAFTEDDVFDLLNYLFNGGGAPACLATYGDANGDSSINIADAIYLLDALGCTSALPGDVNDNQIVSLADVDYLLAYMFSGGPAPVPCTDLGDIDNNGSINLADATTLLAALPCPPTIGGDANGDDTVNLADAVLVIQYLFGGGPAPQPCVLAGDINGDSSVNIADVVVYFDKLF